MEKSGDYVQCNDATAAVACAVARGKTAHSKRKFSKQFAGKNNTKTSKTVFVNKFPVDNHPPAENGIQEVSDQEAFRINLSRKRRVPFDVLWLWACQQPNHS